MTYQAQKDQGENETGDHPTGEHEGPAPGDDSNTTVTTQLNGGATGTEHKAGLTHEHRCQERSLQEFS
jgi:hypothetical protein